MKGFIFLIVMLALAVAVGINLHANPGMVVISIASVRVDMPLVIAALLFIVAYFVIHYLIWFLLLILNFPNFIKNRYLQFKRTRAKKLTLQGFVALNEGNYGLAESALLKSANAIENPWLNYVYAAKSASHLGKQEKPYQYLRQAYEISPTSEIALNLVKAQLQHNAGQYEQSVNTLMHLNQKALHNPLRLNLLQKNYVKLNWHEPLADLLKLLKQEKVLNPVEYQNLEEWVWSKLLISKTNFQDSYALWQKIPKASRLRPLLAYQYALILNQYHKPIEAQIVLRHALSYQWSEALIILYGQISHPFPQRILKEAENWLKEHAQSPGLFLTLGRLSLKEGLLGKAQRYFEASIALSPQPQSYAELGALYEQMNQPEESILCYKKGILTTCETINASCEVTLVKNEKQYE